MSRRKERHQLPRLTKGKERRGGSRAQGTPSVLGHDDGGIQEGLDVHLDHDKPAGMCGFRRRWPTATGRWGRRERDSRSVAGGADQPADGARYEVVEEARLARLPHVSIFTAGPWLLDCDTPSWPAGRETELTARRDGQKSRKKVAKRNSACTPRPAHAQVLSSPRPHNPDRDFGGCRAWGFRRRAGVGLACWRRGIEASARAQTLECKGSKGRRVDASEGRLDNVEQALECARRAQRSDGLRV